jgi:hypothetical protein
LEIGSPIVKPLLGRLKRSDSIKMDYMVEKEIIELASGRKRQLRREREAITLEEESLPLFGHQLGSHPHHDISTEIHSTKTEEAGWVMISLRIPGYQTILLGTFPLSSWTILPGESSVNSRGGGGGGGGVRGG